MLSVQDRAIVKSTVPLLESGGEALITHFYRMMLSEYPEVRPLFNQAHQASGDQPRALANGVLMYARHIDQLDQLGDLVAKIINKHVALQILPEHYPIVGTCLLRAIAEVLGEEIATPEVIAAWGAAYGQLADILIGAETSIYDQKEQAHGGWRGAREFIVAEKVEESAEITSFYFEPADKGPILVAEPGQYIGMKLILDGEEVRRNYSLSALANKGQYRISVKREAGGRVSNYLHDQLHVGASIQLFPPSGRIHPERQRQAAGADQWWRRHYPDPGDARSGAGDPAAGAFHPLRAQWQCACLPRLDRRPGRASPATQAVLLLRRR